MYIADLAFVVFTGIKHTAEWYLASYKQHDAGSSKDFMIHSACYDRYSELGLFLRSRGMVEEANRNFCRIIPEAGLHLRCGSKYRRRVCQNHA